MIGLLQYIGPSLQLVIGILVFHEVMAPARWAGTAIIWMALVVLSIDGVRNLPRRR